MLSSSTRLLARRQAVRNYTALAVSAGQNMLAPAASTVVSTSFATNTNYTTNPFPIPTRSLSTNKQKSKNKKRAINGSRGSRGHGWFLKYRQGRGGRHLQGEYWDRQQQHYDMQLWNDAVVGLGCQTVFLDVAVEQPTSTGGEAAATTSSSSTEEHEEIDIDVTAEAVEEEDTASSTPVVEETDTTDTETLTTTTTERLFIQVASTVMPETCINFIGLCQDAAYQDTILYRIEKEVGICGGDVLTNTGKTGQCWQDWPYDNAKLALKPNPLRRDLPPPSEEPLAMWHTAGTVAMLCPKVNEIDSRFILCGTDAPHLDGIHRAFGTLDAASLEKVQDWQKNVLTSYGQPKSATLRIVGCGVLDDNSSSSSPEESKPVQTEEAA